MAFLQIIQDMTSGHCGLTGCVLTLFSREVQTGVIKNITDWENFSQLELLDKLCDSATMRELTLALRVSLDSLVVFRVLYLPLYALPLLFSVSCCFLLFAGVKRARTIPAGGGAAQRAPGNQHCRVLPGCPAAGECRRVQGEEACPYKRQRKGIHAACAKQINREKPSGTLVVQLLCPLTDAIVHMWRQSVLPAARSGRPA